MRKNRQFNISVDVVDDDIDYTVRIQLNGEMIDDYEIYVHIYDMTDKLNARYAHGLIDKALAIHEHFKNGA